MHINNNLPLATVLIDTYNYENFIESSIDSVINQNFPSKDIEIIVVDDGSTDQTSEKVKRYKDRIKYIYKPNGGQASAFNAGFQESKGQYILLLDSDDYCEPNRVERVVEEFERFKEVGFILNSRKIIESNKVLYEQKPNFHNLKLDYQNLELFRNASYGTSRTSIRKSVLQELLPLNESGMIIEADLYLNLILFFLTNVSCLNEHLTGYRIHGSNLYTVTDITKLPFQTKCMEKAISHVREFLRRKDDLDNKLINNFLRTYEIEIAERNLSVQIYNNKGNRLSLIKHEFDKILFNRKLWGFRYTIYKMSLLLIIMVIGPKYFLRLKDFYSIKNINKIRNIFIPLYK